MTSCCSWAFSITYPEEEVPTGDKISRHKNDLREEIRRRHHSDVFNIYYETVLYFDPN
jgi:hypothetical protein